MKNRQTNFQPCNDYSETVVARLLERSPGDPERTRWEAHADLCPICEEVVGSDRDLITDIRRLPDPAPVMVRAAVMSRVSGRHKPRLLRTGDLAWGASAAFAGAILGLVLVWSGSGGVTANGISSSGDDMASLSVVDEFDTFIADLSITQRE